MSEQPEARAVCEHFYASHCYRGMSVRLCMTCHEPDWDDLAGQLLSAGRGSEIAASEPEAPALPGVTRWRHKAVEVEAMQLTHESGPRVWEWADSKPTYGTDKFVDGLAIYTKAGRVRASWNDWIVRHGPGDFKKCTAEEFAATYEPAGEEKAPAAPSPPVAAALGPVEELRRIADQDIGGNAPWLADKLHAFAGQLAAEMRGECQMDPPVAAALDLASDPLILSPDEFTAVKTVAAVLGLPGSASEPDGPGDASTTPFQARWPVTASVLRSQVRAAIERWASGDAGDEDPADAVMGIVAPFIESLVAEGLRAERDRADAAEARLVKIGVLVQDTYLAEDILDIIGGEEKGADHG